jgi:hypothetical protein
MADMMVTPISKWKMAGFNSRYCLPARSGHEDAAYSVNHVTPLTRNDAINSREAANGDMW